MYRTIASLCLLASMAAGQQAVSPQAAALPSDAPPELAHIDRVGLLGHAEFLASDALGGRLTGSPGQEAAAQYIAEHFEALGLEPWGDEQEDGSRSWFQEYPITVRSLLEPRLQLGEHVVERGFSLLEAANSATGSGPFDRGLVFVDLRRDMPQFDGAVAVTVLKTRAARGVFGGFAAAMRGFAKARGFSKRAARAGASATVFCLLEDAGMADGMSYFAISPERAQLQHGQEGGMAEMATAWRAAVPQVFVTAAASHEVLAAFGVDDPAEAASMHGRRLEGRLDMRVRAAQSHARNVVALRRGGDPVAAAEAVIYSAHMDHVGTRPDGEVFNGADDNASGTSGLLEIAEAYARAEQAPRRSVLFLAVSGEELGLWGSRWYSDHPTWDINDIVANVNTDMIGRSGPESEATEITVTPSYRHKKFSTIVRDAAHLGQSLGVTFTNGDKYYTRSDHYNFARLGIPVVFFCNGEHEDYHQVTDEADRLDPVKMEAIARLAYWVGHNVANAEERPRTLGRAKSWF
ncbi:MAG: M28 family peptidase [Planctomycetota bacterium]